MYFQNKNAIIMMYLFLLFKTHDFLHSILNILTADKHFLKDEIIKFLIFRFINTGHVCVLSGNWKWWQFKKSRVFFKNSTVIRFWGHNKDMFGDLKGKNGTSLSNIRISGCLFFYPVFWKYILLSNEGISHAMQHVAKFWCSPKMVRLT